MVTLRKWLPKLTRRNLQQKLHRINVKECIDVCPVSSAITVTYDHSRQVTNVKLAEKQLPLKPNCTVLQSHQMKLVVYMVT